MGNTLRHTSATRRPGARRVATSVALLTTAVVVGACGSTTTGGSGSSHQPDPATLNLGYLVNFTHAPALIGVSRNFFQDAMPKATTVKTTTFSAGPAESEALLGGELDAAFVGPGPAINAFIKTKGKVLIVAGTTSGGAGLVGQLEDRERQLSVGSCRSDALVSAASATPRTSRSARGSRPRGSSSNINGGGQVTIDSSSGNSISLQNFEAGKIAGGWVPEPYESEFILQGRGTLAVDEASLWPSGQFPTTVLVVTQSLLQNHPDIVNDLLKGLVKSINWINSERVDRAAGRQHRARGDHRRQSTQGQRPRARVDAPDLHARSVRGRPADRREQRRDADIQQDVGHQGPPRPRPAQHDSHGSRSTDCQRGIARLDEPRARSETRARHRRGGRSLCGPARGHKGLRPW